MVSEDFVLGERVKFDAKLVRRKEYLPYRQMEERGKRNGGIASEARVWESVDQPLREGVLVGMRTVKNGRAVHLGMDEGMGFQETESFRAALVAWSLGRVPVLVPLNRLYRNV